MPSNTARIAKNTLMLYFRQIVLMLINLYAVRVVLEILGTEDFGIFNVVGGVVVLFAFLNGAMTSATQRFLNFALGRNDTEQVRNVYSASLVIHVLIAVLVVILAQTVGLWFFYVWLNIPPERQDAAFVAYQFSVATTVISILRVPYRATIIAHEKMSFFAMVSIVEAMLMLGIVFLLPLVIFDKLIVYSFFVFVAGIVVLLVHKVYCNKTFEIAHFRYCRDKELFRQLIGFSGWSILGVVATSSRTQGTNIVLNIFHGVTVNAAMGIAMQVNSAVSLFVGNFQTAFTPQIIKSYSAKDYDYFMRLIFRTSKAAFCLSFLFVLPLYINADFVLKIWLGNVPEYAIAFTRLFLISSLIMNAVAGPLWISIRATGDIKKYQIISSSFSFAGLPLSILLLWLGFSPVWILVLRVCQDVLYLVWLVFFLGGRIELPVIGFFREVILPALIIAGLSALMSTFVYNLFIGDWSKLIATCLISTVSIVCLMYWIGLTKQEKFLLQNWVRKKVNC